MRIFPFPKMDTDATSSGYASRFLGGVEFVPAILGSGSEEVNRVGQAVVQLAPWKTASELAGLQAGRLRIVAKSLFGCHAES